MVGCMFAQGGTHGHGRRTLISSDSDGRDWSLQKTQLQQPAPHPKAKKKGTILLIPHFKKFLSIYKKGSIVNFRSAVVMAGCARLNTFIPNIFKKPSTSCYSYVFNL